MSPCPGARGQEAEHDGIKAWSKWAEDGPTFLLPCSTFVDTLNEPFSSWRRKICTVDRLSHLLVKVALSADSLHNYVLCKSLKKLRCIQA